MSNLSVILVMIGFLGFVVTIVQIIINKIKKRNISKKKNLIGFALAFIVGVGLTPSNSDINDKKENSQDSTAVKIKQEDIPEESVFKEEAPKTVEVSNEKEVINNEAIDEKEKNTNYQDIYEDPKKVDTDIENNVDKIDDEQIKAATKLLAETQLKENYKEFCDIETKTEEGVFFVNMFPKDALEISIMQLMITPDEPNLVKEWYGMTESLTKMSQTLSDTIGEFVSVNLYNPTNSENVIFTTFNGIEYYNFLDEYN